MRLLGRLLNLSLVFVAPWLVIWLVYQSFGGRGVALTMGGLGVVVIQVWVASFLRDWWRQRVAVAPRRVVGQYERCMRCRRVVRVDALTLQDDGRKHCPTCDQIIEMEGGVA